MIIKLSCISLSLALASLSFAQSGIPPPQYAQFEVDFSSAHAGLGAPGPVAAVANGRLAVEITRNQSGIPTKAFAEFVVNTYFLDDQSRFDLSIYQGDPSAAVSTIDAFFNFGCDSCSCSGSEDRTCNACCSASGAETPETRIRDHTFNDRAELMALEKLLANPSAYFAEIRTESAPDGILRGRLRRSLSDMTSANSAELRAIRGELATLKTQLDTIQNWIQRIGVKVGIAIFPEDR